MKRASKLRTAYKFTAAAKGKVLELILQGKGERQAGRAVGVDRRTIYRHARTDKAFGKALAEVFAERDEAVEEALYQAAISGNVVAVQVWLYNRLPERWTDKRQAVFSGRIQQEVTGKDGLPIQTESRITHLSLDQDVVIGAVQALAEAGVVIGTNAAVNISTN